MISQEFLEKTAYKLQTTSFNLAREYLQHRFLTYLYQKESSRHLFSKGGTALKIVFQSPRFSEDLDFSIFNISLKKIEDLLEDVLIDLKRENLDIDISVARETTGGYIFVSATEVFNFNIGLTLNLVRKTEVSGEMVFVNPEITPGYSLQILRVKDLIGEKLLAAISRRKARDFFDLYFILRSPSLRSMLKLDNSKRKNLESILKHLDSAKIAKEINPLLPKSFYQLVKNIPKSLLNELI